MYMKSRSEHFKLSHYPRLRLKSSSICIKLFFVFLFFLPQILSDLLLYHLLYGNSLLDSNVSFKIIKRKIVTGASLAQHDCILVPAFICPTLGILNRKISLKQGFITTVISSTSSRHHIHLACSFQLSSHCLVVPFH